MLWLISIPSDQTAYCPYIIDSKEVRAKCIDERIESFPELFLSEVSGGLFRIITYKARPVYYTQTLINGLASMPVKIVKIKNTLTGDKCQNINGIFVTG